MKVLTYGRGWVAGLTVGFAIMMGEGKVSAQRPLGIDVSSFQSSTINWTNVKSSGVTFAWAKAAEGTATDGWVGQDPDFTINVAHAKAAGVILGYYYYCHPESDPGLAGADAEASFFWGVVKSSMKADGLTLMPMLDFEQAVTNANPVYTTTTLSQWANRWCQDIVNLGASNGVTIKPVIYTYISYANGTSGNGPGFDSTVTQWPLDMANVEFTTPQTGAPAHTTPWSTWAFWQYNWMGVVPGIMTGEVDEDVFNGTAATLQNYVVSTTNASVYYWDPQGTTGSTPYTGSMSASWEGNNWSSNSAGLASPSAWPEGQCVCFGVHVGNGTPAFTVTANANHTFAGMFDGPLAPNSCTVTVNGSGILTLAPGPQGFSMSTSTDGSTAAMTISNVIAGTGQVVVENFGQLSLNGANTYSGGTQLGFTGSAFNGTVNFLSGSAFGSGTITLSSLGNGATLAAEGTTAVTILNTVVVTNATTNNIIGNPAGVIFSGPWTLSGGLTLGSGGATNNLVTISGAMSGAGYLSKFNPGILALGGNDTYAGGTAITAGTLSLTGVGKLGGGTYAGNITNNGTFTYASSSTQVLSGVVSGTGNLNENGPGGLTLTGANTYSGGTALNNNGVLQLVADSGLGAVPGSPATNITLNGGCLKNTNATLTLSANRTIVLGTRNGYVDAAGTGHPVTINGKITGTGELIINLDTSPVVLVNTGNNYAGTTIVGGNGPGENSSGTQAWLKLGASGVIPNGPGAGNVLISKTLKGLFDLAGFTQTINGLEGDGTVDNTAGNGVLTVGNNNQDSIFSGTIQNSAGTLTVTKIGSGSLQLGGTNTYMGATTVIAGTLAFNGGSIGASTVSVASAAALANLTTNVGLIGGTTTLNGGALIQLTGTGGSPSAIGEISVGGDLSLNGNVVTISVSGAALAVGTYRLMDCAGTLSGSANATPTIAGTPLNSGYTATVNTIAGAGGHVDLVVAPVQSAPPLMITGGHVDSVGGNFIFSWQAVPGTTYHVVGSTNATAPLSTWTNVTGPIMATDTNVSVTNPITSAGFFDVVSP